jgi:hypothetical protein
MCMILSKQLRAIPSKLIHRYLSLSLRGARTKPRFGLIPRAGDPRTRVLISVLPDSMVEGWTGLKDQRRQPEGRGVNGSQ